MPNPIVVIVDNQPTVVVAETPTTVSPLVNTATTTVTPIVHTISVTEEPHVVEINALGMQGPTGPSAQDVISRLATQDIGGHRVVRSVSATHCDYADCEDLDHGDDTLGVSSNAALTGDVIAIYTEGTLVFNGWTWTPGLPVFLRTNGTLSQTPPDDGFVQIIGFAEAADTLFISIQPAIYFD